MKLLNTPVYISSLSSVSPLGNSPAEIWKKYINHDHSISRRNFEGELAFAAFLPEGLKQSLQELRQSSRQFEELDDTVLFAIFVARDAVARAGWKKGEPVGINIGSSRGATGLFEKYHKSFLQNGTAEILASPTTTLGNVSSWVAQDLQSRGPEFSHSVTCSTALHAIINAVAWLQAGMAEKFIAGGSEAALTPFTIAQMKAMKIYASEDLDYPCRALDMDKKRNSMVLGEGAGVVCLQKDPAGSIAKIIGIGYATEKLEHSVSISANAVCLQRSMKMAIGEMDPAEVDVVVMHAPGTIKGDRAELQAVKAVFGENLPAVTSNKWKLGHTFGASGILSLELAILMLEHQEFIPVPFSDISRSPSGIRNVLVNAVGFGGNAVSVLITKNN